MILQTNPARWTTSRSWTGVQITLTFAGPDRRPTGGHPSQAAQNITNLRQKFGHSVDPKTELKMRISILKDYGAKCTGLVQVAGSQKDSFDVLQSKCSILVSGQGVVFMYDWNSAQWNVSDKQFDQFSSIFFFFESIFCMYVSFFQCDKNLL